MKYLTDVMQYGYLAYNTRQSPVFSNKCDRVVFITYTSIHCLTLFKKKIKKSNNRLNKLISQAKLCFISLNESNMNNFHEIKKKLKK